MEHKTRKVNKKEFLKKHGITIGASIAASAVTGIIMYKIFGTNGTVDTDTVLLKRTVSIPTPISKKIDEDIFTAIAPAIEEAVLNSGVENFTLERNYDLDGLTHKFVTVNIERIMGD